VKHKRSKPVGKAVFFVIFALIAALTLTTFFGVSNYYADEKITYIKGVSDIRFSDSDALIGRNFRRLFWRIFVRGVVFFAAFVYTITSRVRLRIG